MGLGNTKNNTSSRDVVAFRVCCSNLERSWVKGFRALGLVEAFLDTQLTIHHDLPTFVD